MEQSCVSVYTLSVRGRMFVLCTSHWTVTQGEAGQLADWSSILYRRGTCAPKLYSLRGSFKACLVGFKKIPAQERSRQSHDEKLVTVKLVAKLHGKCDLPVHLDVVSWTWSGMSAG